MTKKKLILAAAPAAQSTDAIAPGDLLDEKEVAAMLRMSPGSLRNWRSLGIGIPYSKIGKRTVRYRRADVDAFVASGAAQMEAA
jgi:predicted DNA-binding transcriptional regulator AlpA